MKLDRKPRNKPMHLWVPYFNKEARIYNGKKIVPSISGAGRAEQVHVKELN